MRRRATLTPAGMWGNATTVWVVNTGDDKLYAYVKATMARDANKDITLDPENADPWGIWSDDTTIWVSDTVDAKLYAYTLADGMRVSETGGGTTTYPKDVTLDAAANPYPRGIWSNDTTIWVANDGRSSRPLTDKKLFAYTLSGGTRDADRDIVLFRDHFAIRGIWSDGTTIWVADEFDPRFHAYTLSSGIRDTDKEFLPHTPPNARYANNRNDTGIWSDGTSMWVADSDDDKLYAYKMPPPTAGGTTLRTLTLSAGTLRPAFNFMRTGYRAALANGVSQVTVTAVAQNSGSTAEFLDYYGDPLADADDTARGHQVDVHAGVTILNVVHIKVTASNGDALTYRVVLERDSDRFYGWTSTRDVNTLAAAGNLDVSGLWGDATTIWASDLVAGKLFAYNKADGARNVAGDISLDADNDQPSGIGSDGTTLWVGESGYVGTVDDHVYKLFAYTKATGVRDADKDITLDADNTGLGGLWGEHHDHLGGGPPAGQTLCLQTEPQCRVRRPRRRQGHHPARQQHHIEWHLVGRNDHVGGGLSCRENLRLRAERRRPRQGAGVQPAGQPNRHSSTVVGRRDDVGREPCPTISSTPSPCRRRRPETTRSVR